MNMLEQLRRSRQSVVKAGDWEFTIRRPTPMEWVELEKQGGLTLRAALRFVDDWDLRAIDIVPGGSPDPVPFDAALFEAWAEDHPELWSEIASAVGQAFADYMQRLEADAKN